MTVNQIIISAMQPFGLPVTADFFGGGNKEYITFNYVTDQGAVFADDIPTEDVLSVQIHYFLPASKDYLENKKEMRRALLAAGFTYPEVTVMMEPGNEIRHIIFECEIENDYEMEE